MRMWKSTPAMKSLFSAREGTAAVEFAMCLPLLLILLFAGIEIGRLLTDYHAVSKSVRDATRYLTRVGVTCPGTAASTGPLANYIDTAGDATISRNLAMTGTVDTPTVAADYLLSYWTNTATVSSTVTCILNGGQYQGVYAGQALIPQITMTATVPFAFLWGTLFMDDANINMTLSHTEVHVGE